MRLAIEVLIGGADERQILPPREYEHYASIARRLEDQGAGVADPLASHMDVRPARRTDAHGGGLAPAVAGHDAGEYPVGPRARGVHDGEGVDVHLRPALHIPDRGPVARPVRCVDTHDLGPVGHRRSRLARREDRRDDEPGVVDLGVKVTRAPQESVGAQSRLPRPHIVGVEHLVTLDVPKQRERVVEPHPRVKLSPSDAAIAEDREVKLERTDEVRRDPEESPPLLARLEDEVELEVLQVAQAPVHEP